MRPRPKWLFTRCDGRRLARCSLSKGVTPWRSSWTPTQSRAGQGKRPSALAHLADRGPRIGTGPLSPVLGSTRRPARFLPLVDAPRCRKRPLGCIAKPRAQRTTLNHQPGHRGSLTMTPIVSRMAATVLAAVLLGDGAVTARPHPSGLARANAATARFTTVSTRQSGPATACFRLPSPLTMHHVARRRGRIGPPLHQPGPCSTRLPRCNPAEAPSLPPGPTRKARLVALEYVVLQDAWQGPGAPALFGRDLELVPAGNFTTSRPSTNCTPGSGSPIPVPVRRLQPACVLRLIKGHINADRLPTRMTPAASSVSDSRGAG